MAIAPFVIRRDLRDLLLAVLPQNNQRIIRIVYGGRFWLTLVSKFGSSLGGEDFQVPFHKTGLDRRRAITVVRDQAQAADQEANQKPDHKPA